MSFENNVSAYLDTGPGFFETMIDLLIGIPFARLCRTRGYVYHRDEDGKWIEMLVLAIDQVELGESHFKYREGPFTANCLHFEDRPQRVTISGKNNRLRFKRGVLMRYWYSIGDAEILLSRTKISPEKLPSDLKRSTFDIRLHPFDF